MIAKIENIKLLLFGRLLNIAMLLIQILIFFAILNILISIVVLIASLFYFSVHGGSAIMKNISSKVFSDILAKDEVLKSIILKHAEIGDTSPEALIAFNISQLVFENSVGAVYIPALIVSVFILYVYIRRILISNNYTLNVNSQHVEKESSNSR